MTADMPAIARIAGLRRCVSDLKRSVDFYRGALGFEPVDLGPSVVGRTRLTLGSEWIELIEVDASSMPRPAFAPDPRFQHAAIVAGDMDAAWHRLSAFQPDAITIGGPQRLPVGAGGVTAFKFRDPDGHPLELITFPPGSGDPRWQRSFDRITLGIDHFAVVVADADRSIAFYAMHGLQLKSRQVNEGPEQARLDGLEVSVVEVIALEAPTAATPHIELLCYRVPSSNGRPGCKGSCCRDLIAGVTAQSDLTGQHLVHHLVDPDGHELSVRHTA